ncbi:MAG: hypothetical protein ACYDGR_12550 [Candidatus Dormibacteria bacterium]
MAKTQPFTVRLNPGLESRIARLAKRVKRSKGAILGELADEAERTRRYPGIAFRGADGDRRAWILGTSLDVWQVIEGFHECGDQAESLLSRTELNPRHLDTALAYYREFRGEIDEAVDANHPTVDEVRASYPFIRILPTGE